METPEQPAPEVGSNPTVVAAEVTATTVSSSSSTATAPAVAEGGGEKVLTKSQMRKARRLERLAQHKQNQKAQRKLERKRKAELIKQGLAKPKKRPKKSEAFSDVSVVIDMGFEHLMKDKDILSAFKQIQYAYSTNRRSPLPLKLFATSFGGKTKTLAEEKNPDYHGWQMTFDARPYNEIFEKDKLVYLTAESPNVLEKLEANKVYVVGGLVDHNSQKGLCHKLATEKGLQTARLPIDEFVEMKTRKILAINHVVEILVHFQDTGDWTTALTKVIPKRKEFKAKGAGEDEEDQAEEDEDDREEEGQNGEGDEGDDDEIEDGDGDEEEGDEEGSKDAKEPAASSAAE